MKTEKYLFEIPYIYLKKSFFSTEDEKKKGMH